MSDDPETTETPYAGGLGKLNIDDTKVTIIRHPNNKHLDEPTEEQPEPPEAA